MRDKLEKIIAAYEELEQKMVDPAVVSDPKEYARIAKEHADQAALVAKAREYLQALDDIEAAKEMLHEASDAEEKEMLQADISDNEAKLPALEEDVKYMLIPGDPNDEKDTIVEIRAGVGRRRRPSLPVTSLACTSALPSLVAGRPRSSTRAPARRAASRPSSSRSRARRSTPS